MSTTPEPLTEETLAYFEWRARHMPPGDTDKAILEASLAEVRRLRKCQQEDWCPGVPVACQKHVDQPTTLLHDAKNLLLERARQAEELFKAREEAIAQRDVEVTRARAAEDRLAEAAAIANELQLAAEEFYRCVLAENDRGIDAWSKRLREILDLKPREAVYLQRARRAVVEAAREWVERLGVVVTQDARLAASVDALKRLEART